MKWNCFESGPVVSWLTGREIIPFSLLACLFTCTGSMLANALVFDRAIALPAFLLRLAVGYTGAVAMAAIALPFVHAARKRRRSAR